MNKLQSLEAPVTFCVSLDGDERIDSEKILHRNSFGHPVYTKDVIEAQNNGRTINGVNHSWFCGAYWRNGFHEDGVWSGIRVALELGADIGIFKDTYRP